MTSDNLILLTTINSKYIHQNLAIRLLYAINKNYAGLNWKEYASKEKSEIIANYCVQYQVVAFSCYIWNITKTFEVASIIKRLNPACEILLGGPEVSYEWEELIASGLVDYIITGEGEIPFTVFLNTYPNVENVPGLIWKKEGTVIENKKPETFNLDQLAAINPYIFDTPDELKTKISYIEASRGCPHSCEYCLAGLDNNVRYLPLQTIQSNLSYLMENGQVIKFLDRTFNARPKFAISILKFILDNYRPGNIFQFEIKADISQPELIDFIQKYVPKGIFRFEIGIQTLNAKSNQEIQRKQNFENIRKFIEQVNDKIELHLDLIVGLPHDYWDDIKYGFEEVFRLFQPELQLGFLKFLKGTAVRNTCNEHGYKFQQNAPYQIISSKYLTENELNKIDLLEHALEIYWNKKRAVNTLKYIALHYSIFDFLLELGNFFKEKTSFHRHDISIVAGNLYDFVCGYLPNDMVARQLVALDYYLHYKVKPKVRFLPEIEKSQRIKMVNVLKLNLNKFRYIIHRINFNPEKLLLENSIETGNYLLIIQYDGENKAKVLLR